VEDIVKILYSYIIMDAISLLLGIGGLYIVSNRNNDNTNVEKFTNKTRDVLTEYPVSKEEYKISHNQHTDKYFDGTVSHKKHENKGRFIGLTGETIDETTFTHSNMKPFFGGKIKGGSYSENSEYILDNLQGNGSQSVRKVDQAPLFKPKQDMSHIYGTPNNTDFVRSRINPSMNNSNTKPWEEVRVGPGLGLGYNSESSKLGYNNGMDQRDICNSRTVDDLRVASKPKESYSLIGREGPANSQVKEYSNLETHGAIEKYSVDTDYELGPSRWFTTTGVENAPTVRSKEFLRDQNRIDTTREYYGATSNEGATYVTGETMPVHRNELPGTDIPAATSTGKGPAVSTDYGNGSYRILPNNRVTTDQTPNVGGAYGSIKAIISPILDIVRPTRKEHYIDNIRPTGNIQSGHLKSRIYDPSDRTKTTIREQTGNRLDFNHLNVQNQGADAYTVTEIQPSNVNRSTTSTHYIGGAGPGFMTESMNYDSAYRQHNNNNKTHVNRPNPGGMSILNGDYNTTLSKSDNNIERQPATSGNINYISGREIQGLTYSPDLVDKAENKRNDPDLLRAFKNNPYTHSLHSH